MENELANYSSRIKNKVLELNKKGICIMLDSKISTILSYHLSIKTNLPVHVSTEYLNYPYPKFESIWFPVPDDVADLGLKYINTFLLEFSEQNNLLLLSSRDYVEKNYVRNYHRSEIADYFPLIKPTLGDHWEALRWSEINNLYNKIDFTQYPQYKELHDLLYKPDEKAYGTDITYAEFEWLMDIEKLYNYNQIVKRDEDPTKHPKWFTFNIRQKQLIAQLHQIEKNTRYKVKKYYEI